MALARDLFGTQNPGDERRAALGVVRVANALMERAIRAISVERGDDPRDCALVAFGGAGPLHAVHLAEALGIRTVLVPRYPGVLSALGMIAADVTRESTRALLTTIDTLDPATLAAHIAALADEALTALAADGEDLMAAISNACSTCAMPGNRMNCLHRWGAAGKHRQRRWQTWRNDFTHCTNGAMGMLCEIVASKL